MAEPAAVAGALAEATGTGVDDLVPVAGGDINLAFRAELADGRTVFVKAPGSPGSNPIGCFSAEADGLARLAATRTVRVPEVVAWSDDAALPFLALEWIPPGRTGTAHDEALGRALAALHLAPTVAPTFGLERGNVVGAVLQDNRPAATWPEFLAHRRLVPFATAASERGALPPAAGPLLDRVLERLPELVGPAEPPSLLHGDLWGGNAITDRDGRPVLVDPAVYRGHREIDLAMMHLFGGFSARTFAAYAEAAPLADGHQDRVALNQLVPLLVHAILFGAGYGRQVVQVLRRYA